MTHSSRSVTLFTIITLAMAVSAVVLLNSCSKTATGTDQNRAPAKPSTPSGPAAAFAEVPATYSSSSSDPDGDPLTFVFYWGDGDTSVIALTAGQTSANAEHTYQGLPMYPGSFRIVTVAIDDAGSRSDSSSSYRISVFKPGPLPPTRPEGDDTIYVFQLFTFSSVASSPLSDSVKMEFDWGDGSPFSMTVLDTNGSTFSAPHIYLDTGRFFIKARAIDQADSVSEWSLAKTVQVINLPPVKPSTPSIGGAARLANTPLTFESNTFDPEGDNAYMVFFWGGGDTSWTPLQLHSLPYSAQHEFADTGTYFVRSLAIDQHGNKSDTSDVLRLELTEFPVDTVFITTTGLSSTLNTIRVNEGIRFISQDNIAARHTFVSDTGNVFNTGLMKFQDVKTVRFKTPGSVSYHCDDHPNNNAEKGVITIVTFDPH